MMNFCFILGFSICSLSHIIFGNTLFSLYFSLTVAPFFQYMWLDKVVNFVEYIWLKCCDLTWVYVHIWNKIYEIEYDYWIYFDNLESNMSTELWTIPDIWESSNIGLWEQIKLEAFFFHSVCNFFSALKVVLCV